jgi:hypothetical protein
LAKSDLRAQVQFLFENQLLDLDRRKRGKSRGSSHLVMAGLVPAIPIIGHCAILIEIAGTSPAMTPQALLLLQIGAS